MVALFVLLALLNSCSWQSHSKNKPNIVLILTDDQGWGDVGFNGNQIIETPFLDSLASVAVVFDRFYVSPACAPTRASILTGKYHLATGTSWVTHRKEVMRESEITLAEVLKENGYETGYFGKWHNGLQYPHNPNGQGFNTFFGFCAGHWNSYFNTELEFNGVKVKTKGYITDVLTDSVINYISETDKPFLAVVAYNTPHTPYQVPDKYFDKYMNRGLDRKTAAIYGMCENIDDNLRRIQNVLKQRGKQDNTIFIFLSDNGPNYVRYNGGYKGRKAQVDEGGVRVPFIIDFPNGRFTTRRVEKEFAAHIDLFPTLLDLCRINRDSLHVDGVSIVDVLIDSSKHLANREFYSHQILNDNEFSGSVRTEKYLLTCYPNDTALYNIISDPFQIDNILEENKQFSEALINDYNTWLLEVTKKGITPEPIRIGCKKIMSVELPAHEGALGNNVRFAGGMGWANDWVTNWKQADDFIQWPIEIVKAGKYSVNLLYVCSKVNVGSQFKIECQNKEMNFSIIKSWDKRVIENFDRVKRDEVEELSWGIQSLGVIDLIEGLSNIALVYLDNNSSDIAIKGIEIVSINNVENVINTH